MEVIYNWGIYPKLEANVISHNNAAEVYGLIKDKENVIARGNGRCYGDSSLQKCIFSTLLLNKIFEFDIQSGVIKCEAGVLLDDILQVVVPKGYFLPVTPGTKFITIGGAVASNIHGKNHHKEGAISRYILSFDLLTESGEVITCSPQSHPVHFRNTIGGMFIPKVNGKRKCFYTTLMLMARAENGSLTSAPG